MGKKVYSRDAIIKAAYKLSYRIGINKIKITDVAEELGCSVMPIYEEFGTKDELIHAVSTFSAKNSLASDKVSSLTDRYEKIMEYGLQNPEQLLDFANVKRKFPHQEGVYEDLFSLMKQMRELTELSNQELYDINFQVETFILGYVFRYKNIEYTTEVRKEALNELNEVINRITKKKAD